MSKLLLPGTHVLHLLPVTNCLQLHCPVYWSQSWSKLPAWLQKQFEHLQNIDNLSINVLLNWKDENFDYDPVVREKLKYPAKHWSQLVPPIPFATLHEHSPVKLLQFEPGILPIGSQLHSNQSMLFKFRKKKPVAHVSHRIPIRFLLHVHWLVFESQT